MRSFSLRARWRLALGLLALVVAIVALAAAVDPELLAEAVRAAAAEPLRLLGVFAAFATAFVLRAVAWRRVLPRLPFNQGLAAIHLALGANHVLPFRLGEALRITSVVRRADSSLTLATASTVALRAADAVGLAALGLLAVPDLLGGGTLRIVALLLVPLAVTAAGAYWLGRLRRRADGEQAVRLPGPGVAACVVVAWLCESVLVWQAATWAGVSLDWRGALLVTAASVAAQVVPAAPAGLGTYEAAAVAAYALLGVDVERALPAALLAHALKTIYALVTGAVAVFLPGPGLFGRLRLTARGGAANQQEQAGDGPVVLFLPARDEAARVGAVVARVPRQVAGRRVVCLVVDDGSRDDTARVAAGAGAEVVRLGGHHGLGAAVRRGLAEATALGAVAVAFCDADGEYAPEELSRVVGPILAGEAEYVVGSRFAGRGGMGLAQPAGGAAPIEAMRPHRRFGNRVLTLVLGFVARAPITDGQSGYRGLSAGAAARAEIIHDYNYAQVLTLDLLAKGYRYREVPISYAHRASGRSFVRLRTYLPRVVPAVYREVNAAR